MVPVFFSFFRAFRNLVKFPGLVQHLKELSTTCDISVLINAFLPKLVNVALQIDSGNNTDDQDGSPAINLLEDIVKNIELDGDTIVRISR